MYKRKFFISIILIVIVATCLFSLCSCKKESENIDTQIIYDSIDQRITFGKKYYYLNGEKYDKNEYYLFNADGSASYNFIYKEGNTTKLHLITNFRWTYAGEGNCILIHNGTEVVSGTHEDVMGFGRIMHTTKDVMYWDEASPMCYVCEDFVGKIPNYDKFIQSK